MSVAAGSSTKPFQSTPSVGRATPKEPTEPTPRTKISIHALRGEGDRTAFPPKLEDHYFNPRPPWGGRRYSRSSSPRIQDFNPRPPWGGRLIPPRRKPRMAGFQSTPSVGRATFVRIDVLHDFNDFNPRPPWGGRQAPIAPKGYKLVISIHALRGEGDSRKRGILSFSCYFNPRPPWGGRPARAGAAEAYTQFQSTPSVGRATALIQNLPTIIVISIHALRGEGDPYRFVHGAGLGHFNPRPPWGGRLISFRVKRSERTFQSTPSVGRATPRSSRLRSTRNFNPRPPWGGRPTAHRNKAHFLRFQSTPSVGRATAKTYKYTTLCLYIVHIKLYIFATAVLFT